MSTLLQMGWGRRTEKRKKFVLMICDVYENSTIEILVSMLIMLMLVHECANCTPSCHWNIKFGITF